MSDYHRISSDDNKNRQDLSTNLSNLSSSSSSAASVSSSRSSLQEGLIFDEYAPSPLSRAITSGDEEYSNYDEDNCQSDEKEYTGTVGSSCLNLTNTILGAGMLAMPIAFAHVGSILGLVLVVFASQASTFGLLLLAYCAQILGTRKSSFFACTQVTIPNASVAFDAAIAVKCFGVSISYLVVVGDLMPKFIEGIMPNPSDLLLNDRFWITVAILSISPFAYAKQLNSLRHTSFFALSAVVYLVFVVTLYWMFPSASLKDGNKGIDYFKLDSSFFKTLPIFVFAFTCHQNIFAVHNELRDNSKKQVTKVINYSLRTSLSVYTWIGLIGYITIGKEVKDNLLSSYPSGPIVTIGQFALVLLVLLSYPLQCHPCRACLDKVISKGAPMTELRFRVMTTGILICSYIIAVTITDLSTVLALVGATGSTTICYILPGFLFYKMTEVESDINAPFRKWRKSALALAIYGICVMFVSVTAVISSMGKGPVGGHST